MSSALPSGPAALFLTTGKPGTAVETVARDAAVAVSLALQHGAPLTTLAMVQNGKVYDHWMVDLQPRSQKLRARALRLVSGLGGVSPARAARLLKSSGGRAKTAIVMARRKVDRRSAERRLRAAGGFLRAALPPR
jgi:N-acetylmuramic acid 6-phosphate (MurNAc-6-P) etherase